MKREQKYKKGYLNTRRISERLTGNVNVITEATNNPIGKAVIKDCKEFIEARLQKAEQEMNSTKTILIGSGLACPRCGHELAKLTPGLTFFHCEGCGIKSRVDLLQKIYKSK